MEDITSCIMTITPHRGRKPKEIDAPPSHDVIAANSAFLEECEKLKQFMRVVFEETTHGCPIPLFVSDSRVWGIGIYIKSDSEIAIPITFNWNNQFAGVFIDSRETMDVYKYGRYIQKGIVARFEECKNACGNTISLRKIAERVVPKYIIDAEQFENITQDFYHRKPGDYYLWVVAVKME